MSVVVIEPARGFWDGKRSKRRIAIRASRNVLVVRRRRSVVDAVVGVVLASMVVAFSVWMESKPRLGFGYSVSICVIRTAINFIP